ncbi:uncharacterized protein LOC115903681 [Camarhynchus parvulus]|uniref:uncharacterized protein LOC115903681 n=1 Tax=Geospiza parvula TaxID=87175 RepID=UPI0012383486|nr:uncharacterized protein LOC115903681 [Camarhynchus parvulus]
MPTAGTERRPGGSRRRQRGRLRSERWPGGSAGRTARCLRRARHSRPGGGGQRSRSFPAPKPGRRGLRGADNAPCPVRGARPAQPAAPARFPRRPAPASKPTACSEPPPWRAAALPQCGPAATKGKGRGRGSAPRQLQEKAAHPAPEGRSPGLAPPPPPAATRGARAAPTNVSPSGGGGAARPRFARRGGTGLAEALTTLLPQPPPPSWPPLRRGRGGRFQAEGYRHRRRDRHSPLPGNIRPPMPFRTARAPPDPDRGAPENPPRNCLAVGRRAVGEETPTPKKWLPRAIFHLGWRIQKGTTGTKESWIALQDA